ncbi:MAG: flagellar basal body P-ring formation protein FlgA [Pirellulaceae bacterium]|nr:flagellar basal body P-ring formation protein FlgA [Pirellulaceae bacterium]
MIRTVPQPILRFLIGVAVTFACSQAFAIDFRISLKTFPVSVTRQPITLGDVADITGGTAVERQQLLALDLDTLDLDPPDLENRHQKSAHHDAVPKVSAERWITRRQIEMRLLVDGYQRGDFVVAGPSAVMVRSTSSKQLRVVLEALFTQEIARQFGLDRDAVSVRITNDQQTKSAEANLVSSDFTTTVLLQPQLPIGKTQIQVDFSQPNGNRYLAAFDTQVIVTMEVALSTTRIPRGTLIDAGMFRVIKRPILVKADFADPQQLIGQVAKRDIVSNEALLNTSIATAPTDNKPTIQRNDMLDVIVSLGRNEVRLKNAKAMSAGKVGDRITILNTRSNKQFTATVVDHNLARLTPLSGVLR